MKYLPAAIGVFLSVTSLFLVDSQPASADEEARRQEVWDRADDDLLRYMKESVTFIADGHKTAYDAYSA